MRKIATKIARVNRALSEQKHMPTLIEDTASIAVWKIFVLKNNDK